MMTIDLARHIPALARAEILLALDAHLRQTINDEDIFLWWLEEGVPDGTTKPEELDDVPVEDFVDMWNLANRLLNAQLAEEDED